MNEKLVLSSTVSYGDVDRDERLLLSGLFKLLQESAIRHANQFDTGTRALLERGESWVLNRVAVQIHEYPRYEDAVTVETWSRGIIGFRGYREYRVYRHGELLAAASSLWLYVDLRTKTLTRVPAEIADAFPLHEGDVHAPDLDKLSLPAPAGAEMQTCTLSLRYSDVDGNGHVNNTAYLEFLQTALHACGRPTRPASIQVRWLKEIRPDAARVDVRVAPAGGGFSFSIGAADTVCAQGQLS